MSLFTPQQHGGEEATGQVKKVENLRKAHFFKDGKNRKDAEIFRFFRFSVLDRGRPPYLREGKTIIGSSYILYKALIRSSAR
nr:MAG TPA: hypothetical protein [Caudoviricetes sp.]